MRLALRTGVVAACICAGGCTEGLSPDTTSAPLPGVEDPNAADPNANQPSGSEPTPGTPATNDPQGAKADFSEVAPIEARDPTNTAINKRDTGEDPPPLPTDQSNSESDLAVVTAIRQKITSTDGLSFMARNVKVVVADGKVTLRGPVASAAERETLDQIAREAAGDSLAVDNQLAIARER